MRGAHAHALQALPIAQDTIRIEVIGPRSPFQPFEFVAEQPGGFPILGSEILADSDVLVDIEFKVEWTPGVPDENYVGIQVIAGPEQNSPQRPGLSLNIRRSSNELLLGHRHGGRTDAISLGPAPAGFVQC